MTIFYSNSTVNKVLVDLKYELIQKKSTVGSYLKIPGILLLTNNIVCEMSFCDAETGWALGQRLLLGIASLALDLILVLAVNVWTRLETATDCGRLGSSLKTCWRVYVMMLHLRCWYSEDWVLLPSCFTGFSRSIGQCENHFWGISLSILRPLTIVNFDSHRCSSAALVLPYLDGPSIAVVVVLFIVSSVPWSVTIWAIHDMSSSAPILADPWVFSSLRFL